MNLICYTEAMSPEAQQSMDEAAEAMAKSKALRRDVSEAIDHTQRMQTAAHAAVNEGLTRKLAQTVTMTVSIHDTSECIHLIQINIVCVCSNICK